MKEAMQETFETKHELEAMRELSIDEIDVVAGGEIYSGPVPAGGLTLGSIGRGAMGALRWFIEGR